ncbi:DUF1223 domain-containing protein, partial [Ralstonia pseudosolanacearum]
MGLNRRLLQGWGALTLLAQATHSAAASDCSALHAKSPPHTVAVVELYTSEGC